MSFYFRNKRRFTGTLRASAAYKAHAYCGSIPRPLLLRRSPSLHFRVSAMSKIETLQRWIISYAYGYPNESRDEGEDQDKIEERICGSKTTEGKPIKIYSWSEIDEYISSDQERVESGKLEDLRKVLESNGVTKYRHPRSCDSETDYPTTVINVEVGNESHANAFGGCRNGLKVAVESSFGMVQVPKSVKLTICTAMKKGERPRYDSVGNKGRYAGLSCLHVWAEVDKEINIPEKQD